MKKAVCAIIILVFCLSSTACDFGGNNTAAPLTASVLPSVLPSASLLETNPAVTPTIQPTTAPTASPAPTPTMTPTPSPTPTPAPTLSADSAGEKGILFDIYKNEALADLNGDGTVETITFKAAKTSSLTINGKAFAVKKSNLAQLFAVTDINKSDKYLEIVLTEKYDANLADSEKATSSLYWWDGKSLMLMGGLMDVKFDGKWRTAFHPALYINGANQLTCLARTTQFTDIWYMAHYKPDTSKRILKEAEYSAKLINEHGKLTVKTCCLLLKNITTKYFKPEGIGMYDPASWPHADGRLPVSPATADYTVIAQLGDQLTIVGVYGQNWFKLKTADGYQGWIKVIGGKVQGYWQIMGWTAEDIFEGIMSAG